MTLKDRMQCSQVIAHRGAPRYAPENTLASFRKAHELGAKWVEFDVRLTRDQELIIFHDDTLERLTESEGKVSDTTYEQIKRLKVQGQSIPTFLEVLTFLAPLDVGINVEIKAEEGSERILVEKTIAILNQNWPQRDKLLVSSFSEECMRIARKCDDTLALGCLMDEYSEYHLALAKSLNCVSLHLFHENINEQLVEIIHRLGFYVFVYTVNDAARAQALFEMGVDSVFSDYPDVLNKERSL